jgi:uncharacterized membrane protein YhiD involved in acid resistance
VWFLASSSQSATGNSTLELLFYLTAIVAAVITICVSLRSVVNKVMEKSAEEAAEKREIHSNLTANAQNIENLTEKLSRFMLDVTAQLAVITEILSRNEKTLGR